MDSHLVNEARGGGDSEGCRGRGPADSSVEDPRLSPEVLDAIAAMVVVYDLDGRIVRFNRAAQELTGCRAEDVRGRPVWDMLPPDRVEGAKEHLREMLSRGTTTPCETPWMARDGTPRVILWTHSLLREAGTVRYVVCTGIDVTERRRAEEVSQFLAEAGRKLAASLDYETTLAGIARLAVPILGDFCVIFVVDGESVRRAAVVPADPSKADLARRLMSMSPPVLARARPVVEAVRTGRPKLMPVVTEEVLQALATSREHLDVLHEMAPTAALTVPLVLHDELLGGIHLFLTDPGRHYAEADVRLAEEFASRASLAVGNARLYWRAQESEERFRSLVEATSDWIWEVDANDAYTYASPKVRDLLGYEPEEVLGKTPFDLMPPDEARRVRAAYREAKDVRASFHEMANRNLHKDGHEVVLETSGVPVMDDAGDLHGYRGIDRDVTERKHQEEERARLLESAQHARADAQEANQAKDHFLAVLSHELRNPLAPILAGVGVLRQAAPQEERLQRVVEIIDRNVKLQARLVDDLLDLSRIARGKIRLQRVPCTLDAVVNAAVEAQQDGAARAGLTLQVQTQPGLWVRGDPDRLQQVVMNLLSNSIKFTPAGGEVRVGVWECGGAEEGETRRHGDAETQGDAGAGAESHTPGWACITVEDTGMGIPRELLPQLFSMFRQGEVGGKRASGLGIGLALVKSLTEAHGGRVWAESEGSGKGSRFTVELPLIAAPGPGAAHKGSPEAPGRVTLLLVEDNDDTRSLLADSLADRGYHVLQGASGEEALEILGHEHPDAILSDIGLPGIDGYEMLRRAREMPGMAGVPAFAVTGYGEEEDVRRAVDAGYDGHLTKPIDTETLDEQIREQMKAGGPQKGLDKPAPISLQ